MPIPILSSLLLIFIALCIVYWLYSLVFNHSDLAADIEAKPTSLKNRLYRIFISPFVFLWRVIKAIYRGLRYIIREVIGEFLILGFLRLILWLIKSFFQLLSRALD